MISRSISIAKLSVLFLAITALDLHQKSFAQSSTNTVFSDLNVNESFAQAIAGLSRRDSFVFGSAPGAGTRIKTLDELSQNFSPYGIAGTNVINQEWERYQPFNAQNFVFTSSGLELIATLPNSGGLHAGGINSGQIWSKQTFEPGVNNHSILAFEIRMKIPKGTGAWPASWLYTKQPGKADSSEIDNPEFFVMKYQNQYDWTGFQHGPGCGQQLYSIKTNRWVWHPGTDFSASYHDYETIWTTDAVYKYFDGKLIYAEDFKWTSKGEAQLGIDLAVGTNETQIFPGLQPTSLAEFPMVLTLQHIYIWAR